jgi:hypothetical protein
LALRRRSRGNRRLDAQYFTSTALGRWPLVGTADLEGGRAPARQCSAGNLDLAVGDMMEPYATRRHRLRPRRTIDFARRAAPSSAQKALLSSLGRAGGQVFVRVDRAPPPIGSRRNCAAARHVHGLRILDARDLMDYFTAQVRRA